MRTPDLEFLTLNDFEDIKRSDFFRTQEILFGKSVMDICLSDSDSVRDALNFFNHKNVYNKGSIMEMITKGDQVRRDTFKDINFYPTQQLLQIDFNFRGTIERSQEYNSFKALKMLINFFFENVNTLSYYPLIMNDISILLGEKQIEINDFFSLSNAERKTSNVEYCNIELSFGQDILLPVFSDEE